MNERIINDLAVKSGLAEDIGRGYKFPDGYVEFAELIVRECLKEVKDMLVDESERLYPNNKRTTEYVNERLMDAHDNISDRFGVKE